MHHRDSVTVITGLVSTLSFTLIPETSFLPFPSPQGFQLRILSKVSPEPNVVYHRVCVCVNLLSTR